MRNQRAEAYTCARLAALALFLSAGSAIAQVPSHQSSPEGDNQAPPQSSQGADANVDPNIGQGKLDDNFEVGSSGSDGGLGSRGSDGGPGTRGSDGGLGTAGSDGGIGSRGGSDSARD